MSIKKGYSFSCYKSPVDVRDYLAMSFLKEVLEPTEFDITDKMTPYRNQGAEGSCVGFATAVGVKEYQEKIDHGHMVSLSPRYIYEKAKIISGHKEGTTLKAAMQVIAKDGVCEEKLWPYIAKDPGTPAPNADKNAFKFKVKSYARVTNVIELKQALLQFGATLIGVEVFKGMVSEPCSKTGVVPDPTCWENYATGSIGGHAVTACGYNDNSPYYKDDGHIKFKNSWGQWGDNGYGYLSYKYIKANMLDAFSCVDILNNKPLTIENLSHFDRTKCDWL